MLAMWPLTCDNETRPQGAGHTSRPLTHQLDLGERGLAMKATRTCDGTCKPRCRACSNAEHRAYRRRNPHILWKSAYRKRARAYGFDLVIEDFRFEDVVRTYGGRCAYCPSGKFEELDHFIPICKGGTHVLTNVRPSCAACNAEKSLSDGCPDDRWMR